MGSNDFTESTQDMHRRQLTELSRQLIEAQEKIKVYELGASFEPIEEGAEPNAAQLWGKLLSGGTHTRQTIIGQAMRSNELARACFAQDHEGRLNHLEYELQDVQAKLSATLGFDAPQPLFALTVAVQALKNIMVEGIAQRSQVLITDADYPADLLDNDDDFPAEAGVAEKITEQLKTAGIDLQSICGYEWHTTLDVPDTSICTDHFCGTVNPLHAESHSCAGCGSSLSHEEAERIEMAK